MAAPQIYDYIGTVSGAAYRWNELWREETDFTSSGPPLDHLAAYSLSMAMAGSTWRLAANPDSTVSVLLGNGTQDLWSEVKR